MLKGVSGNKRNLVFKPSLPAVAIFSFLIFVLILILTVLISANAKKTYASTSATYRTAIRKIVNKQRIQGNLNANVTIVEYSDYQCPWCRRFEMDDLPLFIKNYVDTGKVLIIYRDFPLTLMHKFAFKAAEYADCSALQGKYLEVRKLLYKYQAFWSVMGNIYYFLHKKARKIINMKKEQACVQNRTMVPLIRGDMHRGTMLGVTGTPMFYIYKGLKLVKTIRGFEPYNALDKTLKKIVN